MPTFDDIAEFVAKFTATRRDAQTEATSLQDDIGVYGDDLTDLMESYSKKFGVNIESFCWYFHTGEENNFGGLFFRPPNARVQEIPITLGMLLESAIAGKWLVSYPEHPPFPRRWDLRINWGCLVAIGVLLLLLSLCGGKG